jgi:hypothetical protein
VCASQSTGEKVSEAVAGTHLSIVAGLIEKGPCVCVAFLFVERNRLPFDLCDISSR